MNPSVTLVSMVILIIIIIFLVQEQGISFHLFVLSLTFFISFCSFLSTGFLPCVCMCARVCPVSQLCPTVCDPMDCSLPGSSAHGIFQARILVWCHFLLQGIRRFIPKCFLLFDAVVNGIFSFISLLMVCFFVYRNATNFCTFILYPVTL